MNCQRILFQYLFLEVSMLDIRYYFIIEMTDIKYHIIIIILFEVPPCTVNL